MVITPPDAEGVSAADGRGQKTMKELLTRTMQSFLRSERPDTPEAARRVLDEWFGRYDLDPEVLDREVEKHFAAVPPAARPGERFPDAFGG
jgi:hypothetical protein